GELMTWRRQEEGMEVLVSLRLSKEHPKAPWDLLVGRWKIATYEMNGEEPQTISFQAGEEPRIFFRWDRLYRGTQVNEQLDLRSGVWQYHAHRPILRMLSEAGDGFDQSFTVVSLDNQTLILQSLDMSKGIRLTLFR
ncbi:MAG: hypothetical protein AAFU60_15795, partial [Bacteroidota bacterium]